MEKSVGLWIFLEAESTGFADGLNVNVRERSKGRPSGFCCKQTERWRFHELKWRSEWNICSGKKQKFDFGNVRFEMFLKHQKYMLIGSCRIHGCGLQGIESHKAG